MKDDAKRYRRKPAEYTVAARLFDDAGEPVVRLIAGDFGAIEVPWDEFRRDFEAVEGEVGAEGDRCRVGQWLPAGRIMVDDGTLVAYHDDVSQGVYCRWFRLSGYQGVRMVSRHAWDAARRRWIADGRPSS